MKVKQVEAQSVGSKDAEREAGVVVAAAAAAAVPGSAVDESFLQVKQVEVKFVTVVIAPMDFDP